MSAEHSSNDDQKVWRIIEEKEVLDARPWFSVGVQKVELPGGRIVDDYYHIDLPQYVVMAAYTEEGDLVMLRQYKHGYGRVTLALPGGILDEGEDPIEAAKRELLEETGYSADEWHSLGSFIPHSNYECGRANFFLAVNARRTAEPDPGDLEELEVAIMKECDVLEAVRKNEIVSLSNTAAFMLARDKRDLLKP